MGLYRDQVQPRLLDVVMRQGTLGPIRAQACGGLVGDVLELGYGSGRNQPYLPAEVTGIWAVDPSATGLSLSQERRAASGIPVALTVGSAESLPFPDDRFDSALSTFTLCGIPDPVAALTEVARVLKPGASLHFAEHGLAPDASVVRWQHRGNRINRALAGCLLDRDIPALLARAGLTVTAMTSAYQDGAPRMSAYVYEGRATA